VPNELKGLSHSDILWLTGSLCRVLSIPYDTKLVEQQFPPPHNIASLHKILRSLGCKTGLAKLSVVDWQKLPNPAITFLRKTSGKSENKPILILKASAKEISYFQPDSQSIETISIEDAVSAFEEDVILAAKISNAENEENIVGFETPTKSFGFGWFIPELLKHKKIWRDVLLASLMIQIVGLATPIFTQIVIDKVIVHQTQSTLVVLGIAMLVFVFFSSGMTWIRQYMVLHTGNRIDAVLGSQVFSHLFRLPMSYFEHRPTGTLVARLQGVETIRDFVSGAAVTLILDLPFLLIFLAIMFVYSWQLSLIVLGLLALISLISFLMVPVIRERLNKQFMLGARNQAFMTEYVSGMSTVKALQMEPDVDRKYDEIFSKYLSSSFSSKQIGNTYNVLANSIEQMMTLSILVVGALLVMQNNGFTIGMLVAFQMFTSRLSQPMLRLVGLWQEFQQANIAVKRLGDILDMPQEPHTLVPKRENNGEGLVEFSDVSFRYGENHPWLYRNLNLKIKPGHLSVLMGPSGSGKSTLAKLLLAFYLPQEGHIKIDGKDIHSLGANELRNTFGVVPQETVLFSGSIYDNLVMAHPHASFEQIVNACKAAEIHHLIDSLPNGYQTELGEQGVGLSGGQRQRIAIARALLKRPKILIFDEAASSLDQETAEQFAKTINILKGKVTILFIAHHIPKALLVDEVMSFRSEQQSQISVVNDKKTSR